MGIDKNSTVSSAKSEVSTDGSILGRRVNINKKRVIQYGGQQNLINFEPQ